MRASLLAAAVFVVPALALGQQPPPQPPQPPPQTPVFRTGVELLTVDVTALDSEGRQVTDLGVADFVVEVDGDARTIATVEYVKLVDELALARVGPRPAAAPAAADEEAFFSTNQKNRGGGRVILILVDQGNIRTGAARPVMRSASKFLDMLAPGDRVALVAIPGPGALVDFTTDHEKVREGLFTIVGLQQPHFGRFNISLTEALATVERSDALMRAQLIIRECGTLPPGFELTRCELEVDQQAGEMVMQQRQQTQDSLRGMQAVLESLAGIDGPKSVILISEGLVLEGSTNQIDFIARLAADVRASLDVMLLDVPPVDVTQSQRPSTPREDRDKQVEGLESLAGSARGTLHRVPVSADHAFARINRTLAGHYLLGIEARAGDRDGRRHRISVKTSRRGVTINSRRGFLAPMSPGGSTPAEAVKRALRAALPLVDMPVRVATWTYKDPDNAKVRILIAAEVERFANQGLDYTAGIVVVDQDGRVLVSSIEPRTLTQAPLDSATASFAATVSVDPGTYLLRLAFADSEGRIASVERRVVAWQMDAKDVTVGDLVVGSGKPGRGGALVPSVEARVQGSLAGVMEVYAPTAGVLDEVRGTFDVLREESGRPLMSAPMEMSQGLSANGRMLLVDLGTGALPPGRYLARATVTQGGQPKGHIVRPFRIVPGAAADSGTGVAPAAASVPTDITKALIDSLPAFDRQELLDPKVLTSVLAAAETNRPKAKAALADARQGKFGPAALAALDAGDQAMAMFLKGLDLFAQAQPDKAMQQLQTSMQMEPGFAPARLYLGACLAEGRRYREAASLLQSVQPAVVPSGAASRLAGEAWLRAGDAGLAIQSLEKAAAEASGDARTSRGLGMAYVLGQRPADGVTLLAPYLDAHPNDQAALLAAIYGVYLSHSPAARPDALAADRARVTTWTRAYSAAKGPMQGLVDAWKIYLDQAK